MNPIFFHVVIAVSSYFSGVLCYLGFLYFYWGQDIGGELGIFLFWTSLAFFLVAYPCYLAVGHLFKKRKGVFYYLTPVALIVLGVVPTFFILSRWGGVRLRDFFSPEAGLFLLFFTGSALMCYFGFSVFEKVGGRRLFLVVSLGILLITGRWLYTDIEQNRPVLHLVPQEFHGTVEIYYGMQGYPAIQKAGGFYVLPISAEGVYKTSSVRPDRGIRYHLVDDKGKKVKELEIGSFEMQDGTDVGAALIERYEVP
ncbi:hypothetical protein [Ammoniphilus sp. CFH 90114]|uniref:DUF6843 domain-containing protein n=1 Tax=Ammoniphilus sp. CFH 90114 TaxID=2493665 RepID=UPI00100DBC77|nr:hypothetical protein [Ammoniphilus sp. CFH 90114]RXT03755.1 hypothetical protein EIZ39_23230 [Ammoniphilus sp. CFH 90114]